MLVFYLVLHFTSSTTGIGSTSLTTSSNLIGTERHERIHNFDIVGEINNELERIKVYQGIMYSFWKVCWLGFTSNQKQFKLGSIFDMRTGPSNNNVLYYYYRHYENSSNYKYEGTDDTAVTPKRCEKHYAEGIGSGSVGQIPYYLFTQSGNWNNPQRSGISYDCMPYPGTKNKDRNAYGYRITDKNSGKKCGEKSMVYV